MTKNNNRVSIMQNLKQVADIPIVGGGAMSAPFWMTHIEQFNAIVASATGLIGLIYVSARLYYLIKHKGKMDD